MYGYEKRKKREMEGEGIPYFFTIEKMMICNGCFLLNTRCSLR